MKKHTSIKWVATGMALAALGLVGCTSTVSKGVNDQGQAQELVFPDLDKTSGVPEGIFPNVENMRKIGPGVTKDDLYYLIGRPHFREMKGAREWDYVMKFRESVNGPVTVCQYKVIFDGNMKGQSFHWKPSECARFIGGVPVAPRVISLKADALFAFDRYSLADMRPEGRAELDKLAGQLKELGQDARMNIVGHTDRLGSDAYNQRLSQLRANTVREYLIAQGLPAGNMRAAGRGESQPVVQCSQRNRTELIACLAPNRRVDVEVSGIQQ